MRTMTKAALILGTTLVTGGAANAAPPAATYVAKAGASDLYETRSSKLVLASTKNADIKSYAQEMVTDHGKSTAMVKAAAKKDSITPKPPALDAKQRGDIAKLTSAKGTKRDAMYVEQQKASHQAALALQQDYAGSGDKPALKTAAGEIVPVVQHHIEMLNGMPSM